MAKKSAGILLLRESSGTLQVLLAHPGGPVWEKKDAGAWSIPKGEFTDSEEPLSAARREFQEETGFSLTGDPIPLKPLRQPGGKQIFAWAVRGDVDPSTLKSNTFSMEWPPKSGRRREFPEIDRAEWFTLDVAQSKILKGQRGFLEELAVTMGTSRTPPPSETDPTNQ
jgi:predicted NUDIX family NTP pyrophosphohydrolase